jgi:hypothetical protein
MATKDKDMIMTLEGIQESGSMRYCYVTYLSQISVRGLTQAQSKRRGLGGGATAVAPTQE